MTQISLIIPVRDGGEAFQRCLLSVAASRVAPLEVIVVDDGSTDASGQMAAEFGARVLRNDTSRGPAFARNQGARRARGNVLLFIDADVEVHADTIGQVQDAFEATPGLDALIGSYDDAPADEGLLSTYRNLLHHHTHQTARREAATFWGACGAIRRGTFLAVGGFDERYRRPSIEDIELGYRLTRAGCRIELRRDIQVKHLKRWGAATMVRTDLFQRAVPWTALLLRHRRFDNDLNLRTGSRLSVLAAYVLLAALIAALWVPASLLVALGTTGTLFVLNFSFYRLLARRQGFMFLLTALPWHWLYFLYCGLALPLGALRHFRETFSTSGKRLARS